MRPADLDAQVAARIATLPQQAQMRQAAIAAMLRRRAAKGGPPGRR